MSSSAPKIAVVKSVYYPDLWVCKKTNDPIELFYTSLMRCAQVALAAEFAADFYIINPDKPIVKDFNIHTKKNKYEGLPFLDETFHSQYSMAELAYNVDDINWGEYNIVIAINDIIPERISRKYNKILWCYYDGENQNMDTINSRVYDVKLNQDVGLSTMPAFSIGFPYTFLGSNTLENISKNFNVSVSSPTNRTGIFMEINNTTERPVVQIPPDFQEISRAVNMPIIRHNQNIVENLINLSNSKYFVKIHGRPIRGNAVLEAISSGVLVLINSGLLYYKDLIPEYCRVSNARDVIEKIKHLEKNPDLYTELLKKQKEILRRNYFERPIVDLFQRYDRKCAAAAAEKN